MKQCNAYTQEELADILSVSKQNISSWEKNGKLVPTIDPETNARSYHLKQVIHFEEIQSMVNTLWDEEEEVKPLRKYSAIELFAGAGGLALGMELAGFESCLLNEIDKDACATLQKNRPLWNIIKGDVAKIDFTPYKGQVDFLSGGFPCQAFSYAGNQLGFEDTRGTLFFEFARAIKEVQPLVFLGENVRGLQEHENGKTLETIKNIISDLGYTLVPPRVLRAVFYKVPQKRERLFLVGIRNDVARNVNFSWPAPYKQILTVRDALKAGKLYSKDVPSSEGQQYPKRKRQILSNVPPGGYWRNLSDDLQREYMQGSYFLGGGKTGMARRLSWDQPSLTLTCAPAQKQTERCHPEETRPLSIREYARIQTFPDDWTFIGSISSQYKQIGNAVPVNLAHAMGRSLIRLLNDINKKHKHVKRSKGFSKSAFALIHKKQIVFNFEQTIDNK